jgi:beta-glucosidase
MFEDVPLARRTANAVAHRTMSLPRGLLVAALCAAMVAPASARVDPQQRCQETVAAAGRILLGRSMVILGSCRHAIERGVLPPGTACVSRSQTRRTLARAARAPEDRIRRACSDAAVAALVPAGECAGERTVADLAACIRASHEGEAESLVAVTRTAGGRLDRPSRRCAAEAFQQARRLAGVRLRSIQRCKSNPDGYQLPAGGSCGDAPGVTEHDAALRSKAAHRIAAACDAAALAGRPIGAPCDGTSGDDLARCLLDAAASTANAVVVSEYPDVGICGDTGRVVEQRIDQLLGQMTIDEKLEQMHGSTLVQGTWRTAPLDHLGIPGFAMVDGPRGVGRYAGHATAFPVGSARGATWDAALEEQVGEAIGAEVRAKAGSVLLAPTMNILRHPRWGRSQETYGEDTVHLGRMSAAFIRGVQRHVLADAKHFAANSIEDTRFTVNMLVDERTLREVYLPHFREAVREAHVGSVMSAYNLVNGQHCAENFHLLSDVLRTDWGFAGFVVSDWVAAVRSTVPSVRAGTDVEMPAGNYYGKPLTQAVMAGTVSTAEIDDVVRRILRSQLCFRLDSDPPRADPTQIETPAHLDVALAAAREGSVLLRNEHRALPLDRSAMHSIAVVGSLAAQANLGDHGSSWVVPTTAVAPLDGIRSSAGGAAVTYIPGPVLAQDEATIASADAAIVVAGLTTADEGEGLVTIGDRVSMGLPNGQDGLIAAVGGLNARTIVVLEGGSALTMPWVGDVAAVLMAWYPGQRGGAAIADLLFGDVNPSGKLPVTFPVAEADLPPFDNVSSQVTYGYLHGYRWVDQRGTAPLFPFGFGLSYTTFRYANLRLDASSVSPRGRVLVTADVTNTGDVAGDEVAQLYVGYRGSRVERAVRDLKGFSRVHLEPGETRSVTFTLRAADLVFWDVATGRWSVEPITYEVTVGPSSRELPLSGTFTVEE